MWDACELAKVDPPDATSEFFNDEPPDDRGVEVDLEEAGAAKEWSSDYANGFEVDVTKLPPGLTTIRFYNGW